MIEFDGVLFPGIGVLLISGATCGTYMVHALTLLKCVRQRFSEARCRQLTIILFFLLASLHGAHALVSTSHEKSKPINHIPTLMKEYVDA